MLRHARLRPENPETGFIKAYALKSPAQRSGLALYIMPNRWQSNVAHAFIAKASQQIPIHLLKASFHFCRK
jgi:hypothetical protein